MDWLTLSSQCSPSTYRRCVYPPRPAAEPGPSSRWRATPWTNTPRKEAGFPLGRIVWLSAGARRIFLAGKRERRSTRDVCLHLDPGLVMTVTALPLESRLAMEKGWNFSTWWFSLLIGRNTTNWESFPVVQFYTFWVNRNCLRDKDIALQTQNKKYHIWGKLSSGVFHWRFYP